MLEVRVLRWCVECHFGVLRAHFFVRFVGLFHGRLEQRIGVIEGFYDYDGGRRSVAYL